ncbi:Catechol 2,3-dioxygenase [Rhizobiales bacterium GAS113]|nr:Catechol 2,3-dioxygenase [Rhizobiales bacterium GAS113]
MKIVLTSVLVDDQAKALAFYRDVLGFEPKLDIPMGEHRWLTLTSPGDPEGVQLVLEPDGHPAAKPFKAALMADGIPYTSFAMDDVHAEHVRLSAAGVRFTQPPTVMGPITTAVFDDTCGNLIQIAQQH